MEHHRTKSFEEMTPAERIAAKEQTIGRLRSKQGLDPNARAPLGVLPRIQAYEGHELIFFVQGQHTGREHVVQDPHLLTWAKNAAVLEGVAMGNLQECGEGAGGADYCPNMVLSGISGKCVIKALVAKRMTEGLACMAELASQGMSWAIVPVQPLKEDG